MCIIRVTFHCDSSLIYKISKQYQHVRRLSEVAEEWEQPETKRRRENETGVKIECDDANDAYAFALPAAPTHASALPDAAPALPVPAYVLNTCLFIYSI